LKALRTIAELTRRDGFIWVVVIRTSSTIASDISPPLDGADGGKRIADLALLVETYFGYSAGEAKADRRNRQLDQDATISISPCRY
jgi:hypothetical protein